MNNNVIIVNHPLINHKIALLRDVNTGTKQFRETVCEISTLLAYEALKDVPTVAKEVTTPLETVTQYVVKENSVAIVPILRAGLGMVNGVLALLPTAEVGHIGIYRDPKTLQAKEYYCKLPDSIADKKVIVLDPMLATGGSACEAISLLKQQGCDDIKLMSIIAAPQGIDNVLARHKDVQIFVACVDRQLNDDGYIVPGFGDAGNRLYGTK